MNRKQLDKLIDIQNFIDRQLYAGVFKSTCMNPSESKYCPKCQAMTAWNDLEDIINKELEPNV